MKFRLSDPYKFFKVATIVTLGFLVAWGLVLVVAEVKPFWCDEWRLIYNLKFKSAAALWGPLDYTQQFPRVYLQLVKAFTSRYDYSYFIMRLPSYLAGVSAILLSYYLMNRMYSKATITRFLFALIVVSSVTFCDYFVQVKQYTMEILLSLVAVWQLTVLLRIYEQGRSRVMQYGLLCASFLVVPYFSYTYPIAVAPVFMAIFFQTLILIRSERTDKLKVLVLQWLPVLLGAGSIVAFYAIDVSHLMQDKEMHAYWSYRMLAGGSGPAHTALKFWDFFAQAGTGLLFEIIFGVLGIGAFGYATYGWVKKKTGNAHETEGMLVLYALLVITLSLALFVAGKLPIEPKFNAFALPSIAILIVFLLDSFIRSGTYPKVAKTVAVVLLVGLIGNVYSQSLRMVMAGDYSKRMDIYNTTEHAIEQAQAAHIPILVTPEVAYPDAITVINPNMAPITASSVLETFPAYKVSEALPVYSIPDLNNLPEEMKQLPPSVHEVLACDGLHARLVKR